MPIKSYIAYPVAEAQSKLVEELSQLEECAHIEPSNNEEIVVLVTETRDEEHEKVLEKSLNQISSLQCLALVFGHAEESPIL